MKNKIPYITLDGKSTPRSNENVVKFNCVTAIIKNIDKNLYLAIEILGGEEYGLVGGKLEEGESKDEAIIREIEEETGYKNAQIKGIVFEEVYSRGYKKRKDREEEALDKVYYIEVFSDNKNDIQGADYGVTGVHYFTEHEMLNSINLTHHKVFFEEYLSKFKK